MKAFTTEEVQDLLKSYPLIEDEITEATEKVEAVLSIFPHVMATLKKLEAENADLRRQLRDALERC
jgi:hypothetical protein